MLDFEGCRRKHLRHVGQDEDKIASLRKVSATRIRATRQITKDPETVSIIVQGYYEAIKELLTALLLKDGWKSDNHECLILYFRKNYPDFEYEASVISEVKDLRNRITYDGLFVKPWYLEKRELELLSILSLLERLIAAGDHTA